jgi:transposase-like protein
MRTVNTTLVDEYAEELRSVLPLARRAVGTQRPDSPARLASDRANELLVEYADQKHGNITHLARELEGTISLPGLRRRLRAARGQSLGSFSTSNRRGSTDPADVVRATRKIKEAREHSPDAYRDAVREVYADNVSLTAVAEQLGISYYSLWSAGSTS